MELLLVMGVIGLLLLLGAALVERLVEPRKRSVKPCALAERKRAIVRNGFKSRMRNHREFGL